MPLNHNAPSRIREFRHLFAGHRRIVATIRIDMARAELLHMVSHAITNCEWDGSKEKQPSVELYPEFRIWMEGVLTDIVKQTNKRIIFPFEPPDEPRVAEIWLYSPGEEPRLVGTLHNLCGKPLSEALAGMPPKKWEDDPC